MTTTSRIAIYIAGPYTLPDPCINTNNAIKVANELVDAGFVPHCPHLSHFWHTVTPKPYETWMALDTEWLLRSDGVLRLPGDSPGADREIALANEHDIPVFYSIEEISDHFFNEPQPFTLREELHTLRHLASKLCDPQNAILDTTKYPELFTMGWKDAWACIGEIIRRTLEIEE